MVNSTDGLTLIQGIEKSIEDALWTSVADEDYEKSLGEYDRAKVSL